MHLHEIRTIDVLVEVLLCTPISGLYLLSLPHLRNFQDKEAPELNNLGQELELLH
jgi:hypothetical protein